ncbi:MAG: DUF983 domain-containing protein [Crocinitomicaceae bacterium]|nr:DUF983 domain-containing protein [Crocinitomicaceae bacterium]
MNKESKLYSIFKNKCPKCHEGQFFESNNPYNLKNFSKMPDECPVCGQKYEPETGFYYGAMYVSYAFGVAIFVAVWVSTSLLFPDMSVYLTIGLVLAALVLLFPVSFRLARLVWINIFVKYSKEYRNSVEQKQI